jgi:uncharacterized protein YecA (UPF0149 family)
MGVIAESMVAYAQPLLDQTDGSVPEMQKAMTLAQMCWNLALFPEKELDAELAELRPSFGMDDGEFEDFRLSVVLPMIRRHHDMFPHMPRLRPMNRSGTSLAPQSHLPDSLRTGKYPGTGRNAPCPCNSGRKYKRCCGR